MIGGGPLRREQLAILATLALLTAVAWALTLSQMQGMAGMGAPAAAAPPTMDHGGGGMPGMSGMPAMSGMPSTGATPSGEMPMGGASGSDPGVRLALYLGMWVSMMAAMMLPAAAPMILMFGTVYRTKRERGGAFVPTWVFVAGYLAVWTAFGAYAWWMGEAGDDLSGSVPLLRELAPRLAALAMLAAGAYQLTPLKERCLAHCRSPLSFVMQHWRPGIGGALRMGAEHGVYCVGCCWVLFVLLVAVGLASLPWMGLITLIVLAEKLVPRGRAVTLGVAALLAALGLLTLVRPELLAPTMS